MLDTQECFNRLYYLAEKFNVPLSEYKKQDFCTDILAHEIAHWIYSNEIEKQEIKNSNLHCYTGRGECVENRNVIFERQEEIVSLLGLFVLSHIGDLGREDIINMGWSESTIFSTDENYKKDRENLYELFWAYVTKLQEMKILDGNKLIIPQ